MTFEHAACAGENNDLFFPAQHETYTAAKRICRDCRSKQECLDFALRNNLTAGCWGGLTPEERSSLSG